MGSGSGCVVHHDNTVRAVRRQGLMQASTQLHLCISHPDPCLPLRWVFSYNLTAWQRGPFPRWSEILSTDNRTSLTVLSYSGSPAEFLLKQKNESFISWPLYPFFPSAFYRFTISIPLQSWCGHYGPCLLIHMDINYKIIHSMRTVLSRYAIFSMVSLVFQKSFANFGNAWILASQILNLLVCQCNTHTRTHTHSLTHPYLKYFLVVERGQNIICSGIFKLLICLGRRVSWFS